MSKPLIQVENLSFEYPGTRALDNLNFTINQGSITALVGPNGAGKSTLLRCIAALDYPLSGRVLLDSLDVLEDPRTSHASIGYLSDDFGLYNTLTVKQCWHFAAASQGVADSDIEQVITETAAQLALADKLSSLAGSLSRGQKQRVAIGQAIIHSPRLLLLDEPASGLDPEARYSLSKLFVALRDKGITLIVSSHILAELEDYCTDMLVLKEGRVLQQQLLQENTAAQHTSLMMETAALVSEDDLRNLFAGMSEVSQLAVSDHVITLQLNEALMPRHILLANLVKLNLAINHFSVGDNSMQVNYLKAVNVESREHV